MGAADSEPEEQCRQKLAPCDLIVLLAGSFYGSIGPSGKSYTELEYDIAARLEKPRLVFLRNDQSSPEDLPERDDLRAKQNAFRERLKKDRVVAQFSTADDLRGLVAQAIHNWEKQAGVIATRRLRLRRIAPIEDVDWREFQERYVSVGRGPDNLLAITDSKASWEHGVFAQERGLFIYRHLSRTNPTFVRGRGRHTKLETQAITEVTLNNQDRITIGSTTFVVEFNVPADEGYTTTDGSEVPQS